MGVKQYPHPEYIEFWNRPETPAHANENEDLNRAKKNEYPESLSVFDTDIPSKEDDHKIPVRVYGPKDAEGLLPVIMNVHGGGFVGGTVDNDDIICSFFAEHVPAVVVSVEYTLAPKKVYPYQIHECYDVLCWLAENAEEFGGDGKKLGTYGMSAGANITAGMLLYSRDHWGPKVTLAGISIPLITDEITGSVIQNYDGPVVYGKNLLEPRSDDEIYAGDHNGYGYPWYLYADKCPNLGGFPPSMVITAEYDPFRDGAINFARHLMQCCVPCELYVMPRVPHGFETMTEAPMTRWLWEGICASYRREFSRE